MEFKKISVKILVVEDREDDLLAINKYLIGIPQKSLEAIGVNKLQVDSAMTASEAVVCLDAIRKSEDFYHLSLNDLEIPDTNDVSSTLSTNHGYNVIEHSITNEAVKKVISFSRLQDQLLAIKSFSLGVIDFLPKPFVVATFQELVLAGIKKTIFEQSKHRFDECYRNLMDKMQAVLAHYFTLPFSKLVTSTSRTINEIEIYSRERYGLDPDRDAQDGLMRQIRLHNEAISQASQSWREQRNQFITDDGESQKESALELLIQLGNKLLPCFAVKRVPLNLETIESEDFTVLTFQNDVQSILQEIILGGLSELPDYGDAHKSTNVSLSKKDGNVEIRFEDSLKPITEADAEKINSGAGIISDTKFGRCWGLSIVQHIAQRGGGQLTVEPKADGNIITYQIPLYA